MHNVFQNLDNLKLSGGKNVSILKTFFLKKANIRLHTYIYNEKEYYII